jgi:hypothetical protein
MKRGSVAQFGRRSAWRCVRRGELELRWGSRADTVSWTMSPGLGVDRQAQGKGLVLDQDAVELARQRLGHLRGHLLAQRNVAQCAQQRRARPAAPGW